MSLHPHRAAARSLAERTGLTVDDAEALIVKLDGDAEQAAVLAETAAMFNRSPFDLLPAWKAGAKGAG